MLKAATGEEPSEEAQEWLWLDAYFLTTSAAAPDSPRRQRALHPAYTPDPLSRSRSHPCTLSLES